MKTRSLIIVIVASASIGVDQAYALWEPEPIPKPNLRASCSFDGEIAMWFYQFIVNPLCEIGIQIIPDYECNCDI